MAGLVPAIHASLPLWGGWRAASAPGGVMICTMRCGYAAFERDTPIPTPPEASRPPHEGGGMGLGAPPQTHSLLWGEDARASTALTFIKSKLAQRHRLHRMILPFLKDQVGALPRRQDVLRKIDEIDGAP